MPLSHVEEIVLSRSATRQDRNEFRREKGSPAMTVRPATNSTNEVSEDKPATAFMPDSPAPSAGIPEPTPASKQRKLALPEVFPVYPFV